MASSTILVMDLGASWPEWLGPDAEGQNVFAIVRREDEPASYFARRLRQWLARVELALKSTGGLSRAVVMAGEHANERAFELLDDISRTIARFGGGSLLVVASGDHVQRRFLGSTVRAVGRVVEQRGQDVSLTLRILSRTTSTERQAHETSKVA
jgi:hypothetical protein